MTPSFPDLFSYDNEANKDFIDLILQQEVLPERIHVLMSHIFNAQDIWVSRMLEKKPSYGVWERHEPSTYHGIREQLQARIKDVLSGGNLTQEVHYTNSQGKAFLNTRLQILFHLINHGTQHRGQIAALLSESGIKPPSNDYIFRRRQIL
ncbi:MAG: DinB family protein [Bacteroidota bacterium]